MATRVTITKALEAKLRAYKRANEDITAQNLIAEIIEKLDDEQGKREAGVKVSEVQTGLGYKALVSLFRSFLGDSLTTPPKPSTPFIIKVVNKAKEQGIDSTNVEQILRGARRLARAPYRLADLVWNADQYYAAGASASDSISRTSDLHNSEGGDEKEEGPAGRLLYTGRPDAE